MNRLFINVLAAIIEALQHPPKSSGRAAALSSAVISLEGAKREATRIESEKPTLIEKLTNRRKQ